MNLKSTIIKSSPLHKVWDWHPKGRTFYKHCGFKELAYRISTTNGIDVDDLYKVTDILDSQLKELYALKISKSETVLQEDPLQGKLKNSLKTSFF
jgi:hypothetical protein